MDLEMVRIDVLGQNETEKFLKSSLNRFTSAKNLVLVIPKTFWISFLFNFFFKYRDNRSLR